MKKKRVRLRKRTYQYPGQEIGEALAFWLNGPQDKDWNAWARSFQRRFVIGMNLNARKDSKARERVINLLSALQEIERLFSLIRPSHLRQVPQHEVKLMSEAQDRANRILRHQVSYPLVSLNVLYWEGSELRWLDGTRPFKWATGSASNFNPLQEHWAVTWAIRRLVDLQRLNRLRPCTECNQFFFAKRDKAIYCSACRLKRYETKHYKDWRQNHKVRKILEVN